MLCFLYLEHEEPVKEVLVKTKLATLLAAKLPTDDFDGVLLTRKNGEVLLMLQERGTVI